MLTAAGAAACPPLQVEPGSKIALGRVLALKSGGKFSVGQPYLEGVAVHAEVLEELKGPKASRRKAGRRLLATAPHAVAAVGAASCLCPPPCLPDGLRVSFGREYVRSEQTTVWAHLGWARGSQTSMA